MSSSWRARLSKNTGALEAAQVNLNYCDIIAPVKGMIGIYQVNEGNVVYASANEQLTSIQQMDPHLCGLHRADHSFFPRFRNT